MSKKQRRFVSANQSKQFASFADYLDEMAGRLMACDECDGRGCVECLSADAMQEAARRLRAGEPRSKIR